MAAKHYISAEISIPREYRSEKQAQEAEAKLKGVLEAALKKAYRDATVTTTYTSVNW